MIDRFSLPTLSEVFSEFGNSVKTSGRKMCNLTENHWFFPMVHALNPLLQNHQNDSIDRQS